MHCSLYKGVESYNVQLLQLWQGIRVYFYRWPLFHLHKNKDEFIAFYHTFILDKLFNTGRNNRCYYVALYISTNTVKFFKAFGAPPKDYFSWL